MGSKSLRRTIMLEGTPLFTNNGCSPTSLSALNVPPPKLWGLKHNRKERNEDLHRLQLFTTPMILTWAKLTISILRCKLITEDKFVSSDLWHLTIPVFFFLLLLLLLCNHTWQPWNLRNRDKLEETLKNRDIPEFPIHYHRQIFAKIGTHGKNHSVLLFAWIKMGTVGRYVQPLHRGKKWEK